MTPIHVLTQQIVTNVSMGADLTSSIVNINNLQIFAVQFNWTAGTSPVGNAILQISIDGTTFVDLTSSAVSGNSGSIIFNVNGAGYSYVRIKYSRTSGTATANAHLNGKLM